MSNNINQATSSPRRSEMSPPVFPPSQPQGSYAGLPTPPPGYPVSDGSRVGGDISAPVHTQSRGDGFWRGCCAVLCCCCLLDACF